MSGKVKPDLGTLGSRLAVWEERGGGGMGDVGFGMQGSGFGCFELRMKL